MEIKKNIPNNTITRKLVDLDSETGNIYERQHHRPPRQPDRNRTQNRAQPQTRRFLVAHRHYGGDLREPRADREISRYYERLPKPVIIATEGVHRPRTGLQGGQGRRDEGDLIRAGRWHPKALRIPAGGTAHTAGHHGQHSGLQGCRALSFIEDGRRRRARGDDAAGQAVHHAADDGHALEKNPILVEFFDPENGAWNSHVSLGEWADCYLIAPATANTLAKMAGGIADNLLLTTYLSARCPVVAAPAMDLDMYAHAATQQNLRTLAERGVRIVEPGEGELASGLTGKGRMAEPEAIAAFVGDLLREKKKSLQGKRLIVTAGATIEAIDPCGSSRTTPRGKWVTPLPGSWPAGAPR